MQYDTQSAARVASGRNRTQLRDEAAAYVRELVISGQAPPGTRLRLGPLAERVEASATPVREALLLLAQEGWVVQEPNRGFRVAPITRADVSDSYLVQSFVAGELAARAAQSAVGAAIEELRRLDAEIGGLSVARDGGHAEELNYRLHNVVYDLGASPRLTWFVRAASRFVPRRFWATIHGWQEHNRDEHRPIIEAIEARDSELAMSLMRHHIMSAGDLLIEHLHATGFWSLGPSADV